MDRDKLIGGLLGLTALVACPCHLPITLALLSGVLAGTTVGAALASYMPLVFVGATAYFIVSLALTGYLFSRRRRGAACPLPPDAVHRAAVSKGDVARGQPTQP